LQKGIFQVRQKEVKKIVRINDQSRGFFNRIATVVEEWCLKIGFEGGFDCGVSLLSNSDAIELLETGPFFQEDGEAAPIDTSTKVASSLACIEDIVERLALTKDQCTIYEDYIINSCNFYTHIITHLTMKKVIARKISDAVALLKIIQAYHTKIHFLIHLGSFKFYFSEMLMNDKSS
jgi:hypothetical protein